jgi:hypothetical protein
LVEPYGWGVSVSNTGEIHLSAIIGYHYLHTAIGDRTRIAYSEILDDEQAVTAAAFWRRAHAWFSTQEVTIEGCLTNNGACYRSRLWAATAPTSPPPNMTALQTERTLDP